VVLEVAGERFAQAPRRAIGASELAPCPVAACIKERAAPFVRNRLDVHRLLVRVEAAWYAARVAGLRPRQERVGPNVQWHGMVTVPAPAAAGRWILAATIIASSMVFIDGTAVNLALPALQTDLHATIVDAQWIVEAYALFLSALILVGGSLGDHFGRKRVFLIGVIGFAAASALCGFARDAGQLIAARAAQGIASALLTPGSLAILGASFDGRQRGRAIGVWSSFTAIMAAAGPVLGGFIVQHASWRWIFFINLPLAATTTVLTLRHVPESHDEEKVHHIDWTGAALATAGLGAIVYALITAGEPGWTPALIGLLIAGVVMLVVFVVVEGRVRAPMMPLALFANRNFSAVNALTFLLYAALGGAMFFLPFDLILVQHYPPTAAGAALLPFIALIFILSPWAGGLSSTIGPKIPLLVGSTITALALAGLALPFIGGTYWTTFFPAILALGFGMSLVVSPLTTTVMGSVDSDHFGVASGINNAVARTAGLLAIAALSLAVVAGFNRGLDERLPSITLPAPAAAAIETQRPRLAAARAPAALPANVRAQVDRAIAESYVVGFRRAMMIAAALAIGGALIAGLFVGGKDELVSEPGSRSP
jgi:EmrB/QacA subfamily drug resistance transporter